MRSLSPARRALLFVGGGTAALLLVCCGGTAVIGALVGPDPGLVSDQRQGRAVSPVAEPALKQAPPADSPSQPASRTKTVVETEEIPFQETTVNDASRPKGSRTVTTPGVPGVKTLTYQVTYTGDVETGRTLVGEEVTRQPVTQVVAVGTKAVSAPSCDPNYSGACVPIASDVDCAGGSGDGPAYVRGPVYVIGIDIYKLDRDHDGVACE